MDLNTFNPKSFNFVSAKVENSGKYIGKYRILNKHNVINILTLSLM